MKIILASKSGVRKTILKNNQIDCEVIPSNVDEDEVKNSLISKGATPQIISKNLAELKANKISLKKPEKIDFVIFRENREDIYAGIEFEEGSDANNNFLSLFKEAFPDEYSKIRFPQTSGIGIKPISVEGSERLLRAAFEYAITNNRKSVTFVHKGNIMKFTEGGFRDWGYELATTEFRDTCITERESLSLIHI